MLLSIVDYILILKCLLLLYFLLSCRSTMQRMYRSTSLSWQLASNLRWSEIILLLLLSKILFYLQCLCFCHVSCLIVLSIAWLYSASCICALDATSVVGWWRWCWAILTRFIKFHFSQRIKICTYMQSRLWPCLLLLMQWYLMIELLQ